MKKMTTFISLLATALLLIAVPAFSAMSASSGFYGPFVPSGGAFGVGQKGASHETTVSGAFYGRHVPFGGTFGMKGEGSDRTALTGAYGVYGPYLPKGVVETTRDNCLVVAMVCPLDIRK